MTDPIDSTEPTQPTEAPTVLPVEPDQGIGDGAGPPAEAEELTGTFGGDAQLEGGCVWLDAPDGTRYEVQYPRGYEVNFAEMTLLGPNNEVVARSGDELTVTGSVGEDLMSICQIGPIFVADTVESG